MDVEEESQEYALRTDGLKIYPQQPRADRKLFSLHQSRLIFANPQLASCIARARNL